MSYFISDAFSKVKRQMEIGGEDFASVLDCPTAVQSLFDFGYVLSQDGLQGYNAANGYPLTINLYPPNTSAVTTLTSAELAGLKKGTKIPEIKIVDVDYDNKPLVGIIISDSEVLFSSDQGIISLLVKGSLQQITYTNGKPLKGTKVDLATGKASSL